MMCFAQSVALQLWPGPFEAAFETVGVMGTISDLQLEDSLFPCGF